MALFETDDPKSDLLKKSARQREELEDEIKLFSEHTEKIVTNALIIGGTLAAAYVLVKMFSGKSKRKAKAKKIRLVTAKAEAPEEVEVEQPSMVTNIVTEIGSAVAAQATTFLLALAKEKLLELVESQLDKKKTDTNNNEHP